MPQETNRTKERRICLRRGGLNLGRQAFAPQLQYVAGSELRTFDSNIALLTTLMFRAPQIFVNASRLRHNQHQTMRLLQMVRLEKRFGLGWRAYHVLAETCCVKDSSEVWR